MGQGRESEATMARGRWGWVALLSLSACGVWALEGALPAEAKAKMASKPLNFGLAGSAAKDYVKTFNEQLGGKVGIDSAIAKKAATIDFGGSPLLDGVDKLAKEIGAKAYAVRDFVYITAKLPPGLVPSQGDGKLACHPGVIAMASIEFPGIRPGTFRVFPWLSMKPMDLKESGKPVVLYIYDAALDHNNPTALYYETMIFEDPIVKPAVDGFSFVLTKSDDPNWPAALLEPAKGGAALYLMTSDGKPMGAWSTKAQKPLATDFAAAAKRTMQANPKHVAVAKKTEEEEKDPKAGKVDIPGLGPKGEEGKTAAPPARPEKKTPDVVEEE